MLDDHNAKLQGYARDTLESDLEPLAANMRKADKDELYAMVGWQPLPSLRFALRESEICRTGVNAEGDPVMIYGISKGDYPNSGIIWMLGTDKLYTVKREFLDQCQDEIKNISKGYSLVYNYTDARNSMHHRWLKWCGFTFINKHEQFGFEGRPFFEFVKITGE